MKLALCNEVIADRPFEAQCAFAAELGYDGLEVAPFTLGDDPRNLSTSEIHEIRGTAAQHGLEITGLHWLLVKPDGLSITSPDDAVRRETLDVMVHNVSLCAQLGGSVLVHGSPHQRMLNADPDGYGRALEIFTQVAAAAEDAGVTYCLEPLHPGETDFVNRIAEAIEVVEQIGSKAFRTMVDTSAAALSEGEPVEDLIRNWMPSGYLAHVQLNDRNRRGPGQGDDRFAPVLKALKDTGYDGVVAMEPFIYKPDGAACAAYAIGYVKGILEGLS